MTCVRDCVKLRYAMYFTCVPIIDVEMAGACISVLYKARERRGTEGNGEIQIISTYNVYVNVMTGWVKCNVLNLTSARSVMREFLDRLSNQHYSGIIATLLIVT